ncbi:hypothetical protein F5Y18DRAFT_424682 [Xylariaceae sp. FL1019]|nr:hypothetical protein F5Y18DRAFT_424682 [Xylariaceae sp. FL1019]
MAHGYNTAERANGDAETCARAADLLDHERVLANERETEAESLSNGVKASEYLSRFFAKLSDYDCPGYNSDIEPESAMVTQVSHPQTPRRAQPLLGSGEMALTHLDRLSAKTDEYGCPIYSFDMEPESSPTIENEPHLTMAPRISHHEAPGRAQSFISAINGALAASTSTKPMQPTSPLGKRPRATSDESYEHMSDDKFVKRPRQMPPFSKVNDVTSLHSDDESNDVEHLSEDFTKAVVQKQPALNRRGSDKSTKTASSKPATPTKLSKPVKAIKTTRHRYQHPQASIVSNVENRIRNFRIKGPTSAIVEARVIGRISTRGERLWSMDDLKSFRG